jgi:chromosomal replication initiator protein
MEDPAARRTWATALGQLQLQVTRPNYETWLKDTVGLAAENGTFIVGTPSDFVSEFLSTKMGPVIAKTVSNILGRDVVVAYRVIGAYSNGSAPNSQDALNGSAPPSADETAATTRRLNSKLTFERFVVGDSNRLAAAAALAAAEHRGDDYNPLVIYGGPGLGKTHLLHAIGHRAAKGGRHVIYTTSEQFTNEFVTAIGQGTQGDFRRKYRSPDILLIDDVQFLVGKERTQEEFFHTFNDLYADDRQIIISSDRAPGTIGGLEQRLVSRFQSGLLADIQPPDEETRTAILRVKAEEQGIYLSPDVEALLVSRALDNVRELEGLLNRVAAYARLMRAPIDERTATQALNALSTPVPSTPPSPQETIAGVARYFGLDLTGLAGPSRAKPIAEARHVAMYLLREDAQLSLKEIGHLLGGRDHSTVIHGCRKISTQVNNGKAHQQLADIRALLRTHSDAA